MIRINLIKTYNYIRILVILPFLLQSCEKKVDWSLNTNVPKIIVVEGVLTNEVKSHEVRISNPMADLNGTPEPVSGALVAIIERTTANDNRAHRLHEVQPGIYRTDSNLKAVYGKLYTLYILYQGREYRGSSFMVPVGKVNSLSYRKIPDTEYWYEMNLEETDRPSMVEILLDWGHLPGFRNLPPANTRARIVYYTVHSIDVNKIFKPAKERIPFPAGTRVVKKQYSMNEFQEDFVRTLMAETEWRGGLFDVQPGNVRTNLDEGAVGYFSVSAVVADSSIILPLK